MDFQPDMLTPKAPYKDKRSEMMAFASFILGITALLTCGCIYVSLICGALGIILALLSKGGELSMNNYGTLGLILSSVGLVLTITFFILMLIIVLRTYGGAEGVLQEYMNIYGIETIEELYESMGIPYSY